MKMIDETLIKIVRGYESSFWLKVHRTCSLHLLSPLAPQNFIILLQNSLQKSWEEKIILKNCRFIEWVLSRFQSNEKPTRPSRLQVVQWKIAHNLCRFSYNFCSTRILSYFVGIFLCQFYVCSCFLCCFSPIHSLVWLFSCSACSPKNENCLLISTSISLSVWHCLNNFQLELLFHFYVVDARILNIVIYCNFA